MDNYDDFLLSKRLAVKASGFDVSPDNIHPSLFPFQRDLTKWSIRKGRCLNAANTGLGKTRMFLETARLWNERTLIIAPLVTIPQTIREASKIDIFDIVQVRSMDTVRAHSGKQFFVTNYEMIHQFEPAYFGCIVLDEASIIKHEDGKYRRRLIDMWQQTPYRLCCTATPAPNDIKEIGNYAEFLSVMTLAEMKAAFFINRTTQKARRQNKQGWSLRGHAESSFYRWLASWCMSVIMPSNLGYSDDGFTLPPMVVKPIFVQSDYVPKGQLLFTGLSGVSDRARVRQATLEQRTQAAIKIANDHGEDYFVCWCGLNQESEILAKSINGAIEVTGSQSPELKARLLDEFLQGEHRVLVTKPKIAGFGMNFQEVCHKQIFVGLSDSWESYRQAWARLRRFGQKYTVETWIVLADVEDAIYHNVMRKAKKAEEMNSQLIANIAQYERAELEAVVEKDEYNPQVKFELPLFIGGSDV